jgi:hypothetical protein
MSAWRDPCNDGCTVRFVHIVFPVLVLVLVVATAAPAAADTQLWTELGVKYDVNKKLTLSYDHHIRFDQDISRLGSFMPEPGVSYRIKKWFRVGAGYRYEYERNNDDELVSRHRAYGWVRVRRDLGELRGEYRLQLQEQWRPDANPVNRHTVRNRGELSWQGFGAIVPGASVETHHILNEEGNTIHLGKVWLTAGVEWEHDQIGVGAFYRLITGQYDDNEPPGHVIGFGVKYSI